jgi:hypothetical protein
LFCWDQHVLDPQWHCMHPFTALCPVGWTEHQRLFVWREETRPGGLLGHLQLLNKQLGEAATTCTWHWQPCEGRAVLVGLAEAVMCLGLGCLGSVTLKGSCRGGWLCGFSYVSIMSLMMCALPCWICSYDSLLHFPRARPDVPGRLASW